MGMSSSFLVTFVGVLVLVILIQTKGQPGFISIDCGAQAGVNYTDSTYGINYVSDADFINTGVSQTIASEEISRESRRQLWRLRSFPEGKRNCYKINVTRGSKYFIRTTFLYGNYDGRNMLPEFDLLLGPNRWDTVTIFKASNDQSNEIIHIPSLDYVQICLVDTGNGTPFITTIEFRTLKNDTYVTQFGSLELYNFLRCDLGSNKVNRYPDDIYDRYWYSGSSWNACNFGEKWKPLNASIPDDSLNQTDYHPGATIMSTVVEPQNDSAPLVIRWEPEHETDEFYVYMHFTEIQVLTTNQTRQFNIKNGQSGFQNFSPIYHGMNTIYSTSGTSGKEIKFSLERTENSTLPPIISAIEIYRVIDLQKPETFQVDVDAITTIKSVYALKRDWQGDPCAPLAYLWDGLNCSYHGNDSPRITTLNLSSSGLHGKIDPSFSNLTMLETLDLSNNNLNGEIPDILSRLQHLKILNLEKNNLSGSIPSSLHRDSLKLSVDDNPYLCKQDQCNQKKNKKNNNIVTPLVASVGGVLILLREVDALLVLSQREVGPDAGLLSSATKGRDWSTGEKLGQQRIVCPREACPREFLRG
ncbi:putative leucine-rich repeat receptor-like protein kinase At2g19210 [Vigna radiata var. radiata]|uniref:Leucine-rich repeat receptor-like protein kinase At2g19210 n=1 Tax=Vigna radiata var. radiata TaxID=3916 RepID=A0A1S3U0H6_VIGRR|nr:putative leucine-rich repeat receptor-like protein kinase At2g19210 [Vigna radiata var. radiata]